MPVRFTYITGESKEAGKKRKGGFERREGGEAAFKRGVYRVT